MTHRLQAMDYGTQMVGGVNPKKGGADAPRTSHLCVRQRGSQSNRHVLMPLPAGLLPHMYPAASSRLAAAAKREGRS